MQIDQVYINNLAIQALMHCQDTYESDRMIRGICAAFGLETPPEVGWPEFDENDILIIPPELSQWIEAHGGL